MPQAAARHIPAPPTAVVPGAPVPPAGPPGCRTRPPSHPTRPGCGRLSAPERHPGCGRGTPPSGAAAMAVRSAVLASCPWSSSGVRVRVSSPKSANRSSRARRNSSSPCAACSRCFCAARATPKRRPCSCSNSTRASIRSPPTRPSPGSRRWRALAGALEAMLREFQTKPEGLNASTKRTLTQAVDFLAMLFTGAATHESGTPLDEKILVVDDEIISRRVIGHSLEKGGLEIRGRQPSRRGAQVVGGTILSTSSSSTWKCPA